MFAIWKFGSEEQKQEWLPRMAAGEALGCFGLTEADAGSNPSEMRTNAKRDGDDWILNGQKIWASRAVWADWCFGIFRTDPTADRHRGLTFILCPLDLPGITVRPIAQLDGDTGFAEIFFDDVRVPVTNTLGEENKGWNVAMATAGFERGVSLRSPARFTEAVNRLIHLWRTYADPTDTALSDAVTDVWMQAEGYRLHTYQTVTGMLEGRPIGAEASLNKIFWSEMDVRIHEIALQILGPEAERMEGPFERWVDGFLFSLSGPIYAGTNEIQRNIIADRVLQLPKGM
jgi:acyl-CoA dehydrogenase